MLKMRGISVLCLIVLLLPEIFSGVLSESSAVRKSRLRRVDNATLPTSPYSNATVSSVIEDLAGGASVLNGEASAMNGGDLVLSGTPPGLSGTTTAFESPCVNPKKYWFADVVVDTDEPEDTEFYIVSLPQTVSKTGVSYPPQMTPPIRGDPGDTYALMHHVCLDHNEENILVVLDSLGNGLDHGTWKLKLDEQVISTPSMPPSPKIFGQLYQIRADDHPPPHRDCPKAGHKVLTLLLQLRDTAQNISWELHRFSPPSSPTIGNRIAQGKYSAKDKNKLLVWETCIDPTLKGKTLSFVIKNSIGSGLSSGGRVGFYAIYYEDATGVMQLKRTSSQIGGKQWPV